MHELTQSTANEPLVFLMIDATGHITGKTGLSPTVTISKNGGAFGSPAGAVSEMANGFYKVAANSTDVDTLGPLILHAEAAGADPVDQVYQVVAQNRRTVSMGLALAKTTNITGFNDIAATDVVSSGAITTNGGAVSSVTSTGTAQALGDGAITNASLAGNMELVFETDFSTAYNATRKAWVTNAQDFVGATGSDPFAGKIVAASVTGAVGSVTNLTVTAGAILGTGTHNAQTGDAYAYLTTNLGALGANATALAPSATALSTATWTATRAAYIDLLAKLSPRLIGTLSGAGTGTEICVYSGVTATYTVDDDGNISAVVFS